MATQITTTDAPWQALSTDEKLERRFAAWLSPPDIKFATPEAEEAYKGRVKRLTDAVQLKRTPDRVPILPNPRGFAEAYCGYTDKDVMYDVDKAIEVANRFTLEFQLDTKTSADAHIGKVYDILADKVHRWPGHGMSDDADGIQYLEAEYMKEDEYNAFFEDPSDYRLRTLLPRLWGVAEPLTKLGSLSQLGQGTVSRFGLPEVKASLNRLIQAGEVALAWQEKVAFASRKLTGLGFPSLLGASAGVPFAQFGDSLRGTHGIMTDMFRQPEKLLEAMERLVPTIIKRCIAGARLGASPIVDLHLHKGADRFMSDKQFRTFYWGPVHKIIMGVIKEGLVVHMRLEGGFNSRLEAMRDGLPKGKTLWFLSWETDMARAKEIVGDMSCITSNVPAALIFSGAPEEIAAYCRHAIEVGGKGGGFIFSMPMEGLNRNTKVENVRTMIKVAKEYDIYR